jgi:hypothetical protein
MMILYNMLGKIEKQFPVEPGTSSVLLEKRSLNPGIYLLQHSTDSGSRSVRIVIE